MAAAYDRGSAMDEVLENGWTDFGTVVSAQNFAMHAREALPGLRVTVAQTGTAEDGEIRWRVSVQR